MKPATFIQALVELEYDTHSLTLYLSHAGDQVLVTHKSYFINANDKWDIDFAGRGSSQTKTTERLENMERGQSEDFMEKRV